MADRLRRLGRASGSPNLEKKKSSQRQRREARHDYGVRTAEVRAPVWSRGVDGVGWPIPRVGFRRFRQGSAPFLVLPALPPDYFATTPHLLGEWPGIRSKLSDLGIDVSLTGVDEAVLNLSGGERRIAQEAGQVALQAKFDLQKSLGLQGASFLVTLVDRWGRDAATDAGIPALQLLNEVYGRGNIVRLEEFAWNQKLFGDLIEPRRAASHSATSFSVTLAISSI